MKAQTIGLALAAFAVVASGEVGAQPASPLGAAPQPKLATPPPAPTVKPGEGGGSGGDARSPDLAAAIAAGDYCKALSLGASARDIYDMRAPSMPIARGKVPDILSFYYDPVGGVGLYFRIGTQGADLPLGDPKLPGGYDQLPSLAELRGPLPPPTPEALAFTQRVLDGLSAEEAAKTRLATQSSSFVAASGLDPATARYMRGPDGDLILLITSPQGGFQAYRFRNSGAYPGLDKLPPYLDAVIPLAAAQRQKARSEPPPPPLNPGDPPPINCS